MISNPNPDQAARDQAIGHVLRLLIRQETDYLIGFAAELQRRYDARTERRFPRIVKPAANKAG